MLSELLVTVIVPVFNTERYLVPCLDSIIKQTYKNIEVIVIDDGSTDNSYEICKRYEAEDRRVKVFKKENAGQGVARNYALDYANGDYIAFVDSDDSIQDTMIECMVNACEKSDSQICVCGYAVHNLNKVVYRCPNARELDHNELMHAYITTKDICGCPWNKLYKRILFEQTRFPEIRANEDAYIMPDLFLKCDKAVIISNALYNQNVRIGSTERSGFSKKSLCILEAEDHLRNIIEQNYPKEVEYIQLRKAKEYVYLLQKSASIQSISDFFEIHRMMIQEIQLRRNGISVNNKELLIQLEHIAKRPYITFVKYGFSGMAHKIKQKIRFFCYSLGRKGINQLFEGVK